MANWTTATLYNRLTEFLEVQDFHAEGDEDKVSVKELLDALKAQIVLDATGGNKPKQDIEGYLRPSEQSGTAELADDVAAK